MKKLITILCTVVLIMAPILANAEPLVDAPRLYRVTCYTCAEGQITASGAPVREGIVAANKKHMGQCAILYDEDMRIIGYFEVLDTGKGIDTDGDGVGDSILNDTSIDVYRNTTHAVESWIDTYGDYCYVQFIDVEG